MKPGDLVYNSLFGIGEIISGKIAYVPFLSSIPKVVHKNFLYKLKNYQLLTDKELSSHYEDNTIAPQKAAKVIDIISGIKGYAYIPNQPSSYLYYDEVKFCYELYSKIQTKFISICNLQLDNSCVEVDKKDKNFNPGDNVFYSKSCGDRFGIVTDHSIFVQDNRGKIYFYKESEKYRLSSLDDICAQKQIAASNFKVGNLITYEGKQAKILSNNIENMNNYIVVKFTKTKNKETKIIHILELKS